MSTSPSWSISSLSGLAQVAWSHRPETGPVVKLVFRVWQRLPDFFPSCSMQLPAFSPYLCIHAAGGFLTTQSFVTCSSSRKALRGGVAKSKANAHLRRRAWNAARFRLIVLRISSPLPPWLQGTQRSKNKLACLLLAVSFGLGCHGFPVRHGWVN
jgi:hypothetical protein